MVSARFVTICIYRTYGIVVPVCRGLMGVNKMQKRQRKLSELLPEQTGRITQLRIQGALRRRLFDLGMIPGALVSCRNMPPARTPIVYCVCGSSIAVRRRDAEKILIELDACV